MGINTEFRFCLNGTVDRSDASHPSVVSMTFRLWRQNQVSILTNRHLVAAQEGALPKEMAVNKHLLMSTDLAFLDPPHTHVLRTSRYCPERCVDTSL